MSGALFNCIAGNLVGMSLAYFVLSGDPADTRLLSGAGSYVAAVCFLMLEGAALISIATGRIASRAGRLMVVRRTDSPVTFHVLQFAMFVFAGLLGATTLRAWL